MTRLTTRIAAGIGALALTASMTACGGRASTAAVVGDQRITVAEVENLAGGLPEQLIQGSPAIAHPSFVLSTKMRSLAAEQVAAELGVPNLRAETEKMLARDQISPVIANDAEARELLVQVAEVDLLAQQIGPDNINRAFARVPVEVNPRFGVSGLEALPVNQGDVLPQLRNPSLSKPAGGAV